MSDGSQLKQQVITLPSGATAARPGTPVTGDTRWNTTLGGLEIYNGSSWSTIGVKDGSSMSNAAASAVDLYNLGIRGKGLYWIQKADGTAIQVYCDLDTLSAEDGKAGWMLVASWSTASSWTSDSTSTATTFGSTPINAFSSNFGNTLMQHMRVKVSSSVDTAPGSSECDFYHYWSSAIQWKTVWAPGAGTNYHYQSYNGLNNGGGSVQRCSLRQFNLSYNLKFGYKNTNQIWNNLSDNGTSGSSTGTEGWFDWYAGLTTPGYTLGVYNGNGSARQDGTLAILPQGYTSDNTAGQDCNDNNAKYGYDDSGLCAWGGTSATNSMGSNTGTQGSNTNMWIWIK